MISIGIIREGKTPPDKRVPFSPEQAAKLKSEFGLKVYVQPSAVRCFSDQEYLNAGIELKEDLSFCDYLFGVKEVPVDALIPNKNYFFFSHTIKKQPYNKKLMLALMEKKIGMIDYECLRNENGQRLLGFGRFAGIVGSYNALLAWGKRANTFSLKPANECRNMIEIQQELSKIRLNPIKIIVTGGGRVAHGAVELLQLANIKQVSPEEYLNKTFSSAVFCNVDCEHYYELKGQTTFSYPHFFKNSKEYQATFLPYLFQSNVLISGHFWDNVSQALFTVKDCLHPNFKVEVIADITCDIKGSIPTTLRASTIADPLYGVDKNTFQEVDAFAPNALTIMAVDNLPCELPADASKDFGNALLEKIIPEILNGDTHQIIEKATICKNGILGSPYTYLHEFASPTSY